MYNIILSSYFLAPSFFFLYRVMNITRTPLDYFEKYYIFYIGQKFGETFGSKILPTYSYFFFLFYVSSTKPSLHRSLVSKRQTTLKIPYRIIEDLVAFEIRI